MLRRGLKRLRPTYELQPGQEEISKGYIPRAAAMDAVLYFHWLLTKVAHRPHINVGENSEILRCGWIFNHGSRC